MRRIALMIVAGLVLLVGTTPAEAGSKGKKGSTSVSARRAAAKSTTRECTTTRGKRKCKRVATFSGSNAPRASLRTEPLARPSGDVWLHADNLNEEVRVNIYKPDGAFDDAALAKLDELFRCTRTGEVRAVKAELYEQLSRIYDHFEGKRVDLVSGFRFAERSSSRHFHASAMDIRIKDVSIYEMKKFAESLDGGNMGIGIYPNSGFVHVDVRAPGEPSYRWTDRSGAGSSAKARKSGKKSKKSSPGRTQPARKPTS